MSNITMVESMEPIECEWAVLCDYALTAQDGKVSVIGISDAVTAPTFPVTHPTIFVVFRVRARPTSVHQVRVELSDPNGELLHTTGGPLTLGHAGVHTVTVSFVGLTFAKAGRYAFGILAGTRLLKSVSLRVIRLDPGAPPMPAPTAGTIH